MAKRLAAAKYYKRRDSTDGDVLRAEEVLAESIEIDTPYGPGLITQGNYVVTLPGGGKIGVHAQDIEHLYEPTRARPKR